MYLIGMPLTFSFAASESDIQGALAVRMEVFTREQNVPPDEELDEYDGVAKHVVAKDGHEVVATARLYFPASGEARIGRMAVLKPYRGWGAGRRMLMLLCEEAKKHGAKKATLHAQWRARQFYAASGFKETGEPFWEAGIKHITMAKGL
jgi:predicted GNAT family N-acyltransferase